VWEGIVHGKKLVDSRFKIECLYLIDGGNQVDRQHHKKWEESKGEKGEGEKKRGGIIITRKK